MVGKLPQVVRQHLKVRVIVTTRQQTEALHFGRDHVGALLVTESTDLSAEHGVVGELVQADLQVAHVDGGLGRRRLERGGIAVLVGLGGPLRG